METKLSNESLRHLVKLLAALRLTAEDSHRWYNHSQQGLVGNIYPLDPPADKALWGGDGNC